MTARSTSTLPAALACLALVFSSATPALAGRSAPAPGTQAPTAGVIEARLDAQGYSPRIAARAEFLDPLGQALLAERALETRREGGFVVVVAVGLFLSATALAVIWWLHYTGDLHWFHSCSWHCQAPHDPTPPPAEHQPPGKELN